MRDAPYIIAPLREHAVAVEDLNLDPANANTHPDRNMRAIMESLREFGQRQVLVARKATRTVIAGNGRLEAARKLGWSHVACVFVDDDDITAMRYAIADNRSSELSEWDGEVLAQVLQAVEDDFGSLEATGFDAGDLDDLLSELDEQEGYDADEVDEGPDAQFDRAAELKDKWSTEQGQLWQIGEHRLLIGDCREADDVSRLLEGVKANIAFTSPPYAQQRDYDKESGFEGIPADEYVDWFEEVQANVREHLADDGSWFVNIKEHAKDGQRVLYVKDLTLAHVRQWGWMFVDEFCWRNTKNGVPGGWGNRFKNAWEPVFHFSDGTDVKFNPSAVSAKSDGVFEYSSENEVTNSGSGLLGKRASGYRKGLARPSNVLEIAAESGQSEHSAPFPTALPDFFIRAFTDKGDNVFDPFTGSGTTIVASHNSGRRGFGMELSPKYSAVTLERLQEMGLTPEICDG